MAHSELARLARRLGRIGIAFIAGLAGLVAMAFFSTFGRSWNFDVAAERADLVFAAGLAVFMATFLLFEWLGVVPRDDPPKPPSIRDTSEGDRTGKLSE